MGALCSWCCPPPSDENESEPAAATVGRPGVRAGKRGTQVKVKESTAGISVLGDGTLLASVMVEQDAAYWEVTLSEKGTICHAGVAYARSGQLLDAQIGDGESSWAIDLVSAGFETGDVLGVAFGQDDIPNLRFFRNGDLLDHSTVQRIRGEVYPAVSIGGDTSLMVIFDPKNFAHTPPGRHTEVRPPRKMM